MGIIKDIYSAKSKSNILIELGFLYGKLGAKGENGYTRTFNHNGNECLWVTLDLIAQKLYLYNEYDCGGMIWEREEDIPKDVFEDDDYFLNWLDEEIGL